MTLSITSFCNYADCNIIFIVLLNVVMLSVVILNVVMLSIVAPGFYNKSRVRFKNDRKKIATNFAKYQPEI
jgi:hypothetical protein